MSAHPDIAEAASQLSQSVARLAGSTADYLGARLDQLDSAIQAERRRWLWLLAGTAATLLLFGAAALFAGLAIVLAYGESSPALASALVAAAFLLLAIIAGLLLWQRGRRPASVADRIARILALLVEGRRLTR